jgi:FixJ family two-component response regulator
MSNEAVHIIDDDPSVRSALLNLVTSAEFGARTYGSIDEFLKVREKEISGCLLLDIRLPGLNGLDFLTSMDRLDVRLPVILMTGHGDIPMTVRGMKAGAIDFLTKPFRDNEVLDAVSRALTLGRDRLKSEGIHLEIEARYRSLSNRERQVMAFVTAGKMNKQIAGELGLSEITVKVHRGSVMRKMAVRTLADLVKVSQHIDSRS